jgi:hypothetical protein
MIFLLLRDMRFDSCTTPLQQVHNNPSLGICPRDNFYFDTFFFEKKILKLTRDNLARSRDVSWNDKRSYLISQLGDNLRRSSDILPPQDTTSDHLVVTFIFTFFF